MTKSAEAFRTISEVSEWLDTPAHVLRFWESRFSQVKPVKRAGGRRYYRPTDMTLLGGIRRLLHEDGITIKGVQKILREKGVKYVSSLSADLPEAGQSDSGAKPRETTPIDEILTIEVDGSDDAQTQKAGAVQSEQPAAPGISKAPVLPAPRAPADPQAGTDFAAKGVPPKVPVWDEVHKHDPEDEVNNLFAEAGDHSLEDALDARLFAEDDDDDEDDGHAAKAAHHIRFGQTNGIAEDADDTDTPPDRVAMLYGRLKSLRDRVERDMRRG